MQLLVQITIEIFYFDLYILNSAYRLLKHHYAHWWIHLKLTLHSYSDLHSAGASHMEPEIRYPTSLQDVIQVRAIQRNLRKAPQLTTMVSACPTSLPAWLADYDRQSPRSTSAGPALSGWMDISQRTARKSGSTGSILWSFDIHGEAQFRLVRSISETLPLTYSSSSSLIQGEPCRSGCVCPAGYPDQLDSSSGCRRCHSLGYQETLFDPCSIFHSISR